MSLSALIVLHNEEATLEDCIASVRFADEILVVLDKCTDGSKAIAERLGCRLVEGAWEIEGDRRNAGIEACTGAWILGDRCRRAGTCGTRGGDQDHDFHRSGRLDQDTVQELCRKLCRKPVRPLRLGRLVRRVAESLPLPQIRQALGPRAGPSQPDLFRPAGLPLTQCMVHHIDRNISDMVLHWTATARPAPVICAKPAISAACGTM